MPTTPELPGNFSDISKLKSDPEEVAQAAHAPVAASARSPSVPFPIKPEKEGNNGLVPSLPPQMASVRSHTTEEIMQMMKRTPLFMTSLDDAGNDDSENIELEAMRALQYEGTPAENALGFKEQGNQMVKAKRWKDAKEFYSKGLAVISQRAKETSNVSREDYKTDPVDEMEVQREKGIEEACYVNRALCNLEMKNYRSTTLDCASALRLNPRNVKAYFRSSLALLALDKLLEASDACSRGLAIDFSNTAMESLNKKISDRQKILATIQQKKHEREQRAQKEKLMLHTALRARNIRIRTTAQPPDMEDATIHLSPDPLSPTSKLMFPVVLLYPLELQSDFVKAFSEVDTIPQHLEYIFPLPWDSEGVYTLPQVDFYMGTGNGGLVKVGKNVTLGKVLASDGVEIVDGIVRINVVPKSKARGWIEELKTRKAK